jgi:L-threonylcarbamoyladenylate synthase
MTLCKARIEDIDPIRPSESLLREAAALIQGGKIIVTPTDTCYMLAANALDASAVKKVFLLKRRSLQVPIHVAVGNLEMAKDFVFLNEAAGILARTFLPGPVTLVLPKKDVVPDILVAGLGTLGIRIPDNKVVLALVKEAKLPLTATSANISGGENPYSIGDVIEQFSERLEEISLFFDQGPLLKALPSTVIDLTTMPPSILREGPILGHQLLRALGYCPPNSFSARKYNR